MTTRKRITKPVAPTNTYPVGSRVRSGENFGTVATSDMESDDRNTYEVLTVRWDDGGENVMYAHAVECGSESEDDRANRHAREFARTHD